MSNFRWIPILFSLLIIQACDNGGRPGSVKYIFDDTPPNSAPTADAGSDQSVEEASAVTLEATGSSDSDGTIASYSWVQTAGSSADLSDSQSSSPSFTAPAVTESETLVFEVTVTDDDGATASDSVDVTVTPAEPEMSSVPESEMEESFFLNELYYEYGDRVGDQVWVIGFYGNVNNGVDGYAFLVDNMLRLAVDEPLPHHSFARLDGDLPPADWEGNQILVFGEIKDFATETGETTVQQTPLITVTRYELVSLAEPNNSWENTFLPPDVSAGEAAAPFAPLALMSLQSSPPTLVSAVPVTGTMAESCDRSIIISGGLDASNNHARYKDNVIAKFNRMKELGYNDDQIGVFYNNGTAIDVNGTNITDNKTTGQIIQDHITQLTMEMTGSCTLTIFVTDHGTGYNAEQGYSGARPALSGTEATSGSLVAENTFKLDARAKTYRSTASFVFRGKQWFFSKDGEGEVTIYERVGTSWVNRGTNTNGDTIISETELGGIDLNGDGDTTDANYGFTVAVLEGRLGARRYNDNTWDTDGDGTNDVRIHWDGTRYVAERLDGGTWKEMGRDTNGDFIIDSTDGGVDWNLDGDKDDQVGFHEGINLWGSEVLWDDAFATMLKPLSDMGVHIMVEMVSCFSGGFTPNLGPLVENIYTGASEDTKHYNRKNAEGNWYAADEIAFLDNLAGLDTDSWNAAAAAATLADDTAATATGGTANVHVQTQTTRFTTNSTFQAESELDEYTIKLDIPDNMVGQVYDFEFILGLQKPRWTFVGFPQNLPPGLESELINGGVRVFSSDPIPDDLITRIKVTGAQVGDVIRIEYTDVNHSRIGYTLAQKGTVEAPATAPSSVETTSAPTACVNHTDHGLSSPSVLEWLFFFTALTGINPADIQLTIEINGPNGLESITGTLTEAWRFYALLQIFNFGNYSFNVVSGVYLPTGTPIAVLGQTSGTVNVDAAETNKDQCNPN